MMNIVAYNLNHTSKSCLYLLKKIIYYYFFLMFAMKSLIICNDFVDSDEIII